jgi:ppGpp synthetase/RelA/SpoT-type nucleotidyltranferase
VESYTRLITDLVAIRALHIFKEEWLDVHGFITRRYNPSEVTAYVRAGDRDTKQFEDQGCTVRPHACGYRSIHYLLKIDATGTGNPQPVELQVRTIFEEAWSEIDHRLRYPRRSKEPILNAFLITFNLLAGLGDEMGAHARALSAALHQHAEALADARARGTEAERRFQAQEQEFRGALSRLQISEKEKTDLQRQLDALQKLSQDVRGISLGAGTLLEGVVAGSGYRLLGPQACRRCGRVFIPIMATPDENPLECPDCRLGPYLRHHSSRETTP